MFQSHDFFRFPRRGSQLGNSSTPLEPDHGTEGWHIPRSLYGASHRHKHERNKRHRTGGILRRYKRVQ